MLSLHSVVWGDVVVQCAAGDAQSDELAFLIERTRLTEDAAAAPETWYIS